MVIPTDPCERCGADPQYCGCNEGYSVVRMDDDHRFCEVEAGDDVVHVTVGDLEVGLNATLSPGEARRIGEALCRVAAFMATD